MTDNRLTSLSKAIEIINSEHDIVEPDGTLHPATGRVELSKEDLENWERLLREAVSKPGLLSTAFNQFHGYSIGNQVLAYIQCLDRDMEAGPIATYKQWKDLGRQVRGGEEGIFLYQPINRKGTRIVKDKVTGEEEEETYRYTAFMLRKRWFVMSQTEGDEIELPPTPDWKLETSLELLDIDEVPFTRMNGNVGGTARVREDRKQVMVNPMTDDPLRVYVHEIAHHELGHTAEGIDMVDDERTPRNLRELEAEGVALIVCDSLDLPGASYSRGYIQSWWGEGNEVPEESARKIFSVANNILRTGRGEKRNGQ